jgi:hypothetical protein
MKPTRLGAVGEPDLPGRVQAARAATSERDIGRSLNVFNFAFMIVTKIYFLAMNIYSF